MDFTRLLGIRACVIDAILIPPWLQKTPMSIQQVAEVSSAPITITDVTVIDGKTLQLDLSNLEIGHSLQIVGVTRALHGYLGGGTVDLAEVLWSQFHGNGSDVLFQAR